MTTRLLLIDDSRTIQRVVRLAFHNSDLSLHFASNLMEAISGTESHKPDIVLADASLPGAKAPHSYMELKKRWVNVPFIILVGSYDSVDREDFVRVGLDCFLNKPFDARDLIELVDRFISKNKLKAVEDQTIADDYAGPSANSSDKSSSKRNSSAIGSNPVSSEKEARLQQRDQRLSSKRTDNDVMEFSPPPPPPDELFRPSSESAHFKKASLDLDLFGQDDTQPSNDLESGETYREKPAHSAIGNTSSFSAENDWKDMGNEALDEGLVAPFLREELASIVRQTVLDYCERHFSRLAREIIAEEIQNLTDSKTRLLIDN